MESDLSIPIPNPSLVKKSIEVEKNGSGNIKTQITADEEGLNVKIVADRLSNLRAGVNTTLRLVKTANSAIRV